MEIPKYDKHDLEAVVKTGEYGLSEFDEYIQELNSSALLSHPVAVGIVSQVADRGTTDLSESQLNALRITTEQFPLEHCIRCSQAIVVKVGEEPDYCGSCRDFIEAQ